MDSAEDALPIDAGVDAPADADACWMHRYPQCGNEILDVCVPYTGCVTYECEGQVFGYCGPGGFVDAGA